MRKTARVLVAALAFGGLVFSEAQAMHAGKDVFSAARIEIRRRGSGDSCEPCPPALARRLSQPSQPLASSST